MEAERLASEDAIMRQSQEDVNRGELYRDEKRMKYLREALEPKAQQV